MIKTFVNFKEEFGIDDEVESVERVSTNINPSVEPCGNGLSYSIGSFVISVKGTFKSGKTFSVDLPIDPVREEE